MGLDSPKKTVEKNPVFDKDKKIYKIAVISDLHFGSKWENLTFLEMFIADCKNQQIGTLLNVGDTVDGYGMYEGQEKEVMLHSAYSYEEYAADHYPTNFGKSFFINGNHDASLKKYEGDDYSFGRELAKVRKDLTFVPSVDKFSSPFMVKGGLTVSLYHGTKSCSDSSGKNRDVKLRSKVLGMMANGIEADLYLFGHCHKKHLMNFMGRTIIGVGCFQNTTPYLESRGSMNDVCGLIVRYQRKDDGHFVIVPEFKFERDYKKDDGIDGDEGRAASSCADDRSVA